jgi:hypothetical protein
VTLPEVVTGNLAGKFGEISLYNQHADFELGSNSNSNSTSPWAIACEPATQPSHAASPLRERFARGHRNISRAHSKAPTTRWAGKEIVPEYDSNSDTAPCYNSDSNPLSGFYSDSSYEFDFGSDPNEPESEEQLHRATPVRTSFRPGYNIYTRREICLLARLQAHRLDRRELTLRRLPRLTSLPGGNTACSSWGAHSYRGGNQRLQPWLS